MPVLLASYVAVTNMKITAIVIISLLSSCRAESGAYGKEKETLRLGILLSQDRNNFDFSGSLHAIEMALETIEADETLPFRFTYAHNDSKVYS